MRTIAKTLSVLSKPKLGAPTDPRTLLGTPRVIIFIDLLSGMYVDFGLGKGLQRFMEGTATHVPR